MSNFKNRFAFSMVELIFVIIIIGILASVAIPKLMLNRTDAVIVKGKTLIGSIRNSIAIQKNLNLMQGLSSYPSALDDAQINQEGEELFDGVGTNKILDYPVISKKSSGGWMKTAANKYEYYIFDNEKVEFEYDNTNGHFDCTAAEKAKDKDDTYCDELTQ